MKIHFCYSISWLVSCCFSVIYAASSHKSGNFRACSANYCNEGFCMRMSTSPSSSYQNDARFLTSAFFVPNGNAQNWYNAEKSCQDQNGELISLDESSDRVSPSALVFIESYSAIDKVAGFWISQPCYLSDQFGILSNKSCTDAYDVDSGAIYLGLCQKNQENGNANLDPMEEIADIYSCQCAEGYGYENCTNTNGAQSGSINYGHTYCEVDPEMVELKSGNDQFPLMYIDHAAYGRPMRPPGSSSGSVACRNHYAINLHEYCVAPNSLAAITFWCQGKSSCKFSPKWLIKHSKDAEDEYKVFYVHDRALNTYLDAAQACSKFGSLANLKSDRDALKALELISKTNATSSLDGLWIDAFTKSNFESLKIVGAAGHMQDACLVLIPNQDKPSDLQLRWESCFSAQVKYGALCQAQLGPKGKLDERFDGDFCLDSIATPVLEYRFHNGVKLNQRDVNCGSLKVDYRRGNTCYKKTEEKLDWLTARNQCWSWGGDLAFPLPKNDDECSAPIYALKPEELWLAGPTRKEARSPIPFDSNEFKEGTVEFANNDLCYPNITQDLNGVEKRRGLCALPVAMAPRTTLPPSDTCPTLKPGDEGWPFPNYSWNVEGHSGVVTFQPCPDGQSGNATWQCGFGGSWIDYPDLSNCYRLNTEEVLEELQKPDSVPSKVLEKLYRNVSGEASLGAGDIKSLIGVLGEALKVQNERLENASSPEDFADSYTQQAVDVISDILDRPQVWFGLPIEAKNGEITKVQNNLDEMAKSLMKNSDRAEHTYERKGVYLKTLKKLDEDSQAAFTNSNGDQITVKADSSQSSISFLGLTSLACIIDNRFTCDSLMTNGENILATGIIGATLLDSNPVEVVLRFKNERADLNITGRSCVFWNASSSDWSSKNCELVVFSAEETVCKCDHLTNFAVLMDINGNLIDEVLLNALLTWVTILGCSLSIISLVICVYVFTAVRGLKSDRTTIHRNLCLCLLIGELLLVSGLDATYNSTLCGVIAGFMHYFFLATFSWMLVEGIHVYLMLVKVFDTGRSMLRYFYAIGYGAPALIVILSAIIVEVMGTHGFGNENYCWLGIENGLIWAFAFPMVCVLVSNSIMFILAISIARKSIQKRGESNEKTFALIKGSFSLLCILGLTWIFGLTYFADGSEWLAVLFTILNSTQGFFILIFHVLLNEKAKQELLRHLRHTTNDVKSYFSSTNQQSTSKDTFTDASSKTYESSRKISSGVTLSSDLNTTTSKVDDGVKYYRGQVTMTVVSTADGDDKKK